MDNVPEVNLVVTKPGGTWEEFDFAAWCAERISDLEKSYPGQGKQMFAMLRCEQLSPGRAAMNFPDFYACAYRHRQWLDKVNAQYGVRPTSIPWPSKAWYFRMKPTGKP